MMEKDPVCGRDVPRDRAVVVFKLGDGKRYRYFCSERCARIFQKSRLGL
jgi:YHS domain-containing protein